MRRGLLVALAALALAAPTAALAAPNEPAYDEHGLIVQSPVTPDAPRSLMILNEAEAIRTLEEYPKVAHWLKHYKPRSYAKRPDNPTNASYDAKTGIWSVQIFEQPAGEIAMGKVRDADGHVMEAWTGPQVAWSMARCTDSGPSSDGFLRRGGCGAFGGPKINTPWVWLSFVLVFLIGLADWRRILSLRNLDLVMLVAPLTISLWFFNHGNIFTSVPFIYPTLFWVLGRAIWIGVTGRPARGRATWPTWVFVCLLVFVGSFRVGLNLWHSNVIDVGYAGVVGAERIAHDHRSPYGNFPKDDTSLTSCGLADASGYVRRHVQTNGHCEDAIPQGDTYGPVAYEAYIPGYWIFGWSGFWDTLPAAHFTTLAFDTLCLIGMALLGLRFGGPRMAAILGFAWVAYPFTQYASNSNTNDMIGPAFVLFGLWLMFRPAARGFLLALGGWTKFAPLVAAPLWLGYPDGVLAGIRGGPGRRRVGDFVGGFLIATALAFAVLLFEPRFLHAAWLFWHRTVVWQSGRHSPFSLWDWKQYDAAGIPDLHLVQRVLQALLVVGAAVLAFVPRRRSPLQLVAFTAALLVGFESVMTYWLYTYVPWFYGVAAAALLLGSAAATRPAEEPVAEPADAA